MQYDIVFHDFAGVCARSCATAFFLSVAHGSAKVRIEEDRMMGVRVFLTLFYVRFLFVDTCLKQSEDLHFNPYE